ncbi:toxin-antitoxin system antitoxin component Xre family [Peptostreptococcus anaerobius CAG:621]|jgi:transcriptional regulator with XRE-family HTH domain|uniref:helix-turn-helix transcriptional regulator n=1 Tax=Peptostreptococcus anaerobius TaxID=1261 RepID=UPI00033B6678|nr:helix-turn-helix transcriptional regulator [Peptostreptococcus anaerobius]CCY49964.1 toxin-antitoxin system antitoxin component Xre family [Peptostreptococcus anaerobius CAG:621]
MNILKNERIKHGLTLEDIAKKLSTTKSNYYKKEIGVVKISVNEAIILARIYNKSVEELFCVQKVDS